MAIFGLSLFLTIAAFALGEVFCALFGDLFDRIFFFFIKILDIALGTHK